MDRLAGAARHHVRIVIAYDIVDDLRRSRVAEVLIDLTQRVEFSVFDGWLPTARVDDAWRGAADRMKTTVDAAFAVVFCRACAAAAGTLGTGEPPDDPGTSWIV